MLFLPILTSLFSLLPTALSFTINVVYSTSCLLNDIFSKKSIQTVAKVQSAFVLHFALKMYLTPQTNIYLFLLLVTFAIFYNNNPPKENNKSIIYKSNYDPSKSSIIYVAGLFEKHDMYKEISEQLPNYNHIYINVNKDDILLNIINEIDTNSIVCVIGYSLGSSLALQFKDLYCHKYNTEIKSILISPCDFENNTFLENDTVITSSSNNIHTNMIVLKHASDFNIMSVVTKQKIIKQLIDNNYQIKNVITKPLNTSINKFLFGGHFYPYHVTLWFAVSFYNLYFYIYNILYNNYKCIDLFIGFIFSGFIASITEYLFHRFLLHHFFYKHHSKHHDLPNKISIIHTPMGLVVFNWIVYYYIFSNILNKELVDAYYIFFPLYYLSFEFAHLLSHTYTGSNKFIRNIRYYHKLHHNNKNINYSFITPFWDCLFGTLSPDYNITFIELLFGYIPFYSFMCHY